MKPLKRKTILEGIFLLYLLVLFWLLFARVHFSSGVGYWEDIRSSFNGVPFYSIRQYFRILFLGESHTYYFYAFVNLFGNILLFVPFGFLAPLLNRRARNFFRLIPTFSAGILAVELLQLLTLRGSCDVDDILLNTFGCMLGWIFWRSLDLEAKKRKVKKPVPHPNRKAENR